MVSFRDVNGVSALIILVLQLFQKFGSPTASTRLGFISRRYTSVP
jgi:hypothetical protein